MPGQDAEDDSDDMDDVQMYIERHSSNVEDKPIDYLGMDEAPKKYQVKKSAEEPAQEEGKS